MGATRVLRPAVEELIADGSEVVAVARSRRDLVEAKSQVGPSFDSLAVDYLDLAALAALADFGAFDAALIYAPGATTAAMQLFRNVVKGPIVEILGSQAAGEHPDAPFSLDQIPVRYPDRWNALVLGWTADYRWHSPEQISQAALNALRMRANGQLGLLRPWADRPNHN